MTIRYERDLGNITCIDEVEIRGKRVSVTCHSIGNIQNFVWMDRVVASANRDTRPKNKRRHSLLLFSRCCQIAAADPWKDADERKVCRHHFAFETHI